MARRGHGEGSIMQRKDGRWMASLTLENRKRKYFYGKTRKEVQDKLNAALYEQKRGILATGPQQTLKAYLENWLEQVYKPTVKLGSYRQYRSVVTVHLIPGLGHIPLQKLTPEKIQAFYAQKLNDGKSPKMVQFIHAVLHQALENAVKWNLIPRNVAKLVTLPRVERYEAQTLTVEQVKRLLEVARGSRIEVMLLVALNTGIRRGELSALRWSDIDFENGLIFVRRTVTYVGGYGFVETEPKTKSSRRKIAVSEKLLEALRTHRENQVQARLKAGEKWHEQGLVFCNIHGGFLFPEVVLDELHMLLAKAGLPKLRFHDLRHTMATILLESDVHPKKVQERLGHSSIKITMDTYSHVLPSMHQDVARKLDDILGNL
jgi:integrase